MHQVPGDGPGGLPGYPGVGLCCAATMPSAQLVCLVAALALLPWGSPSSTTDSRKESQAADYQVNGSARGISEPSKFLRDV